MNTGIIENAHLLRPCRLDLYCLYRYLLRLCKIDTGAQSRLRWRVHVAFAVHLDGIALRGTIPWPAPVSERPRPMPRIHPGSGRTSTGGPVDHYGKEDHLK